MSHIVFPGQHGVDVLGGKANALAELEGVGFSIPAWFVISPAAFKACLTDQQYTLLQEATELQQFSAVLNDLVLTQELIQQVDEALNKFGGAEAKVAVRSSAVDEDGVQHSFAGQLDSFLFVDSRSVVQRIVDVWRSGFSERVLLYRKEAGLALMPEVPAVLVQKMVDADVSGVAFAADPVSGNRSLAVVGSLYGLGTALVSGEADADTFHITLENEIVLREIADKTVMHQYDANHIEGVSANSVSADVATKASLDDAQVVAVAELVRATSRYFNHPQDIEWAYCGDELFLLQSRPITSLREVVEPEGELNIWDNSNIAESYGGITTPLTFSFASKAYEEVYRQFCKILKVSHAVIADNDATFKRMLGLIQGRVYYNLLSWYRVLAMLPGFTVNRAFMEQMMGVKEGLPEHVVKQLESVSKGAKIRDTLNVAVMLASLMRNHFDLSKKIDRFYSRLDHALSINYQALATMPADALCVHYRDLEKQLLTRWDAPLINDFFAMIFHGVLRKLTASWCHDKNDTLHNDLLCGEGGMISAEPAQRVRKMAELIRDDASMVDTLCDGALDEVTKKIETNSLLKQYVDDYLNKFGDRCLDELKLESITLHDDPALLLRSVGQLAKRLATDSSIAGNNIEAEIRTKAENQVNQALTGSWLKRKLFHWILKNARHRVRDRENLRFERTRLFGHVRRVFVEIGKRFVSLNMLEKYEDIFYLEVNEIMGIVEGTTSTTNIKNLVALRREEFKSYETMDAPPDRFETQGIVHQGNRFENLAAVEESHGEELKGLPCCPGVVQGVVRVITDPREAVLNSGEILVAERTDPGWIMLFPASSAILVERGSLLSHSAIVAREMGIPAIVSLQGVTRWLKDGDIVEMDGSRGTVKRIESTCQSGC